MTYTNIIQGIEGLPHYRLYRCDRCGYEQKEYILNISSNCQNCGIQVKLRGYSAIGTEIEDVVDAVLEWLGQGDELALALARKKQIDI